MADIKGFCPHCGAQLLPFDIERDECPSCSQSVKGYRAADEVTKSDDPKTTGPTT
jgi:hypothetical protein